ncbi:MAG: hypothetical protein ACRDCF_01420 [Mycoplasmoidaceae bacterium]
MRKNTKMLIIGLSVLSVVSTVTAITVPVVMHLNQESNSGSDNDNTIQKVLVKEGGIIDEILSLATEDEMITKVDAFNKGNKWDEVFTFTNENEKTVTGVVEEVLFNLDTKLVKAQGVFTIIYKEEIKAASGASVIRVDRNDIPLTVIKSIDYDAKLAAATDILANLLAGASDFAVQKDMINNWNNKPAPIEFENAIKDIVNFSDGTNNFDWDIIVKDVTLRTSILGTELPLTQILPVRIQINLNEGYNATVGRDFLIFDSADALGNWKEANLTISKIGDLEYNTKLEAATKVLADLLSPLDFEAQKDMINSWNGKIASTEFVDAIKGILTFKDGSNNWDWDNVVKDVTLQTNISGSELPLTPILPVKIQINLNDGYIATDGGNLLLFDSDALGNWNQINLIVSDIDAAKKADVTAFLNDLLAGKTFEEQEIEYNSWKTETPVGLKTVIKDIVTFDGLNWDTVVADIKVNTNYIEAGSDILPFDIQIILKPEYNAIEPNKLLITIDSLGTASKINLTMTQGQNYQKKFDDIKDSIILEFDNALNLEEQQKIYNDLVDVPANIYLPIIDIFAFHNAKDEPIKWNEVVRDIEVILNADFTLVPGLEIPPIKIQIILTDKYDIPNKDELIIDMGGFGLAKDPSTNP